MANTQGATEAPYGAPMTEHMLDKQRTISDTGKQVTTNGEDAHAHSTVQQVLARMTAVENAMLDLRKHLVGHTTIEKPLCEWVEYKNYSRISGAVNDLVTAAESLDGLSEHARLRLVHTLPEARRISTSISNVAVYVMSEMNRKTTQYIDETFSAYPSSHIISDKEDDHAKKILIAEMEKLLRHTTSATTSIWSVLDALQKLVGPTSLPLTSSTILLHRDNTQSWIKWLNFLLFLSTFILVLSSFLTRPSLFSPFPDNNLHHLIATENTNLRTFLQIQTEHLNIHNQIFTHQLGSMENKTDRVVQQVSENSLRIDNIWEALGPPNEKGTYYDDKLGLCGSGDTEILYKKQKEDIQSLEKEIEGLISGIKWTVERLSEEIAFVKKEGLRMDLRLSRRINRVEKKV